MRALPASVVIQTNTCLPTYLRCDSHTPQRPDYHPDKHERMKAVFKYYLQKDQAALAPFPGGSEPGS